MKSVYKIKGQVQDYSWGGNSFIPALLGIKDIQGPYAEYWMGAHDKAPSYIESENRSLNDLIKEDPSVLGKKVADSFGRLPFLFKVLDVKDMLSIQVHPSKIEAQKGFKRENDLEIPLSAAHRNYKDDNHKPEIMVALSEFWLLHGFKTQVDLVQILSSVKELKHLSNVFADGDYKALYQHVMTESEEETNTVLQPLIDRILPLYEEGRLEKNQEEFWAARAFKTFCDKGGPIDKGIYSIFFFNVLGVDRGQAVFQDAGIPHAYLEGQNIELMANSDNVLRAGLTPKHVDVEELLKHVNFEATVPNILQGTLSESGLERIYQTKAPDFELSRIVVEEGQSYKHHSSTMEILLLIDGEVSILADNTMVLSRGEVIAVNSNTDYEIRPVGKTEIYKAKCPIVG